MAKTGKKVLILLGTAAATLVIAALLTQRLALGEKELASLGAAELFLVTLLGCRLFSSGKRDGNLVLRGVLCGVSTAVILLMIGFLCDSERVSSAGVLRVTLACVCGSLIGVRLGSKAKEGRRDRRSKRFRA